MRTLTLAPTLLFVACSGGDKAADTASQTVDTSTTTDTDTDTVTDTQVFTGECGAVTEHDLTMTGAVVLASGGPADGADVWIEDRGWAPQVEVLGQAVTDAQGNFTLPITGLTSVEDCWGTLLDYVVIAELGIQRGEREVNTPLYNAILDGTLAADISASPIEMIDTSL
jgi:hypothetical protein